MVHAQNEVAIKAPNVVAVSEKLVTAGQPTAESLAALSKQGFQAVINLAPPTVADAIANEPQIIRDQGLEFISIPIQWSNPTETDFQTFADTMKRLQGKSIGALPSQYARLSNDLLIPCNRRQRRPLPRL